MKNEHILPALKRSALFANLEDTFAEELAVSSKILHFGGGEDISEQSQGSLCLIANGRANVLSTNDEKNVLIRVLAEGDVFGVAGLFSGATEVSRVVTQCRTRILCIPAKKILDALVKYPDFAKSYITFLERRIVFLNRRISAFTAGSCERRLATFLNSVSSDESYEISGIPFSSLARQLDMGRASFYRALDALESDGVIHRGQKSIYVVSRSELKKKYI